MFRTILQKLSGLDAKLRELFGPSVFTDMQARPVFVAWTFGFLICFALLCVYLGWATFSSSGEPGDLYFTISFTFPIAPLLYYSVRGFLKGRRNAFQDLPQRPCLVAMLVCLIGGSLLALLAGEWGPAFAPAIAAGFFSLGSPLVRELLGVFA